MPIFSLLITILLCSNYLQSIVTQINDAIGVTSVKSHECKAVVSQYGEVIIEMLLSEVSPDVFPTNIFQNLTCAFDATLLLQEACLLF